MNLMLRRAEITVGVAAVLFLSLLGAGGMYAVHKYDWAVAKLAEIEPRFARLQGLREAGERVQAGVAEAKARLQQFAYLSEQASTQAGNDAQQRIRGIAEAAGMTVVSSQVLPAKVDKGFDRIAVSLRLEGDLPALKNMLAAAVRATPVLMIESLSVQSGARGGADEQPRLSCQLTVAALLSHP